MSLARDCLNPPIGDGSGYLVRDRDLHFLAISKAGVALWRTQRVPLGMSEIEYAGFCTDLLTALQRDDVTLEDCDVRLKGSAAEFFSGHHKRLPRTADEILDVFRECRQRVPQQWELEEIDHRLNRVWITDGEFPSRRPFDSMSRLGISREPSDIDLQVSSDEIVNRCVATLQQLGQRPTELRLNHPVYNFVRKDLIEDVVPHVYLFSLRTSDALGRHVSVVVFPGKGPPDVSDRVGELSAHFRERDWVVSLPVAERPER
jgi:hypothetical protein